MASNAQTSGQVTDPAMNANTAANWTAHVERLAAQAPPLTARQRARIGTLLAPVAVTPRTPARPAAAKAAPRQDRRAA